MQHERFGRSAHRLPGPQGAGGARLHAALPAGANILHADQHQDHDLGLFFMRVEWALNGSERRPIPSRNPARRQTRALRSGGIPAAFAPLAAELGCAGKLTSSGGCRGGALLLAISALHGRSAAPLAHRRAGVRDSGDRFQSSRCRELAAFTAFPSSMCR
jgi:hypothetical protein